MIARLGLPELATAEPQGSQAKALRLLSICGIPVAEGGLKPIPAKTYERIGACGTV